MALQWRRKFSIETYPSLKRRTRQARRKDAGRISPQYDAAADPAGANSLPPGAPGPGGGRSLRLWSVAVVCAGAWALLWYYSASVADRTLAGWVERETTAGRVYSCGSQSIAGFPFSIQARCDDALATIKNSQPPYAFQAKSVTFVAEVYHPTRLVGDVAGPVTLSVSAAAAEFDRQLDPRAAHRARRAARPRGRLDRV